MLLLAILTLTCQTALYVSIQKQKYISPDLHINGVILGYSSWEASHPVHYRFRPGLTGSGQLHCAAIRAVVVFKS